MRQLSMVGAVLAILVVFATGAAAQIPINVTQDCWTHRFGVNDLETENYCFAAGDAVQFVWKQKLLQTCSRFRVEVYIQACANGKPPLNNAIKVCERETPGEVQPNDEHPERVVACTADRGAVPPGIWDWFIMTECDDTNGMIGLGPDEDVDDECGINAGHVLGGPLILGPEPLELWNPAPAMPGICRLAGEEGTTRPWCFQVG